MAIEWALKFQHNQAVAFSIAKTGDRNDRMAIEMAIENGTKKAAIEQKINSGNKISVGRTTYFEYVFTKNIETSSQKNLSLHSSHS